MVHLVLTALHNFVVPQALLVPRDRVVPLVLMVPHDLVVLLVRLHLAVPPGSCSLP